MSDPEPDKIPHDWKLDDDGEVDVFAFYEGYHNGPVCLRCGETFCKHCVSPERMTEPCHEQTPYLV